MTMTELSDLAGIGRTDLARWLNGRRSIRVSQALKVMAILHIHVVSGCPNAKTKHARA
jgi:transcriptional regulator with XRE-family HTH domain